MTIIIASKDKDFAAPLCEQVKKELHLDCRISDDAGDATLVVTTEDNRFDRPVIRVKNPPVRMNALLSDIEAALHSSGDEPVALGNGCLLQLRQKQLMHKPSGNTADVTDKEAQLLQVLAETKGGVAKEKLLKEVWGIEAELNTHTLETHVYRLRAKFRELMGEEMIAAINGGYGLAK